MGFEIGLFNLWLLFFAGYSIISGAMTLANKKRGIPIEDPDNYTSYDKKNRFLMGQLPFLLLFIMSIFLPINDGPLFWAGLALYLAGIFINLLAMHSFSRQKGGLITSGIYRFSRNPMYIGGLLFMAGLLLINGSMSIAAGIFLLLAFVWLATVHWNVVKEEQVMKEKYGSDFDHFFASVPRYIGSPQKSKALKSHL
ncbi:MAG: methyltransferase family protein [Bacteroidota bacterium]